MISLTNVLYKLCPNILAGGIFSFEIRNITENVYPTCIIQWQSYLNTVLTIEIFV